MSETQVEQYITRAVEQDLAYARGRVRELQTELGRIKAAAARVISECDAFLTGKSPDEDAF